VPIFALPDSGEAPYVDVLSRAQSSIRVFGYLMGYGGILTTLKAKAGAGVKVRVILDQGQTANVKYYDELKAAGAEVLWSDPKFPYMHAKAMVVDDKEVVFTTGNYSKNYSVDVERNFVGHVTDPEDVADVAAIFDADWDRKEPDMSCTRLLVSPLNSRDRLLTFIGSATKTLIVESMQFADQDVRAEVLARKVAGVDVRVLLAAPSWIDANYDAAALLKAQNIPVRWMSRPGVHVKAIVVDGQRAYLGSLNLSWTSISKNREIGIVTDHAPGVKVMTDTFETDWANATPF
jgi:phosphatidylserine/phosphatidylglycerophosphate/cardiolipin synthase-like enzyme